MSEPKWNIKYTPKPEGMVVEEMSSDDIAKYFPDAVRAEMTGRFRALPTVEEETISIALDRAAAHS